MSLSAKLQLKGPVRVVNPPKGLDLEGLEKANKADAVLVFAKNSSELKKHGKAAFDAARADALSWIAYPKAGQLDTDLNRDILWKAVEKEGIRPVRQVSIDDVWSALRFRPA